VSRGRSVERPTTETVVVSPPTLGLPLLDRDHARSATLALIQHRWPEIEAGIASREFAGAIHAMETLAVDIRDTAQREPEEWLTTFDQSRELLYDAIVTVAKANGMRDAGIAALRSCRAWDVTNRSQLDRRLAALGAGGQ